MKRIKQALALMAEYYGRDLSDAVLQMMALDLSIFTEEVVLEAIRSYRRDSDNRSFPLPAQINALCIETRNNQNLPRPGPFSCEPCRDFGFGFVGDTITSCVCSAGRRINPTELARQQGNYDRGKAFWKTPLGEALKPLPYDPKKREEF